LVSFTSFLDFILSVILCPAYNLFLLFLKLPGFSFVHVNFSFSKNYFISILFFLLKYLFLSLFSTYHGVHFYQSNLRCIQVENLVRRFLKQIFFGVRVFGFYCICVTKFFD
jgi:hypothetical protein